MPRSVLILGCVERVLDYEEEHRVGDADRSPRLRAQGIPDHGGDLAVTLSWYWSASHGQGCDDVDGMAQCRFGLLVFVEVGEVRGHGREVRYRVAGVGLGASCEHV